MNKVSTWSTLLNKLQEQAIICSTKNEEIDMHLKLAWFQWRQWNVTYLTAEYGLIQIMIKQLIAIYELGRSCYWRTTDYIWSVNSMVLALTGLKIHIF